MCIFFSKIKLQRLSLIPFFVFHHIFISCVRLDSNSNHKISLSSSQFLPPPPPTVFPISKPFYRYKKQKCFLFFTYISLAITQWALGSKKANTTYALIKQIFFKFHERSLLLPPIGHFIVERPEGRLWPHQ